MFSGDNAYLLLKMIKSSQVSKDTSGQNKRIVQNTSKKITSFYVTIYSTHTEIYIKLVDLTEVGIYVA